MNLQELTLDFKNRKLNGKHLTLIESIKNKKIIENMVNDLK